MHKEIGETPLEAIEKFKKSNPEYIDIPMTYAGRLDPMAEGVLIVLVGEECKNKDKYLGLDKEYEIEVLCGVKTDTQDILGLIRGINIEKHSDVTLEKYVKKFTQTYPMYSSKTVRGKQLYEYARAGEEPDDIPTKEVEIYSIENIGKRELNGEEIARTALEKISSVNGDFRQEDIAQDWQDFGQEFSTIDFNIMKLRVKCSSGTYMRTLAETIGKNVGVGAIAYSIKRVKVGKYQ